MAIFHQWWVISKPLWSLVLLDPFFLCFWRFFFFEGSSFGTAYQHNFQIKDIFSCTRITFPKIVDKNRQHTIIYEPMRATIILELNLAENSKTNNGSETSPSAAFSSIRSVKNKQNEHLFFVFWLKINSRSQLGTKTYQVLFCTAYLPLKTVLDFLKSQYQEIDFLTWFFVYFKLDFYCRCSLQKFDKAKKWS